MIEIFFRDANGAILGTFAAVQKHVGKGGHELEFAVNGGIFKEGGAPVGLLVANGKVLSPLDLKGWPKHPPVPDQLRGNFYVIPNGVFWIEDREAFVADSLVYHGTSSRPDLAIQSGPLLVSERIIPSSLSGFNVSTHKRNGICVLDTKTVLFTISNERVSVKRFAEFMQTGLRCKDALYLDGCRSALFSRKLNRADPSCPSKNSEAGLPMGAMIGVATQPLMPVEKTRN